jgi:hypothetical protein
MEGSNMTPEAKVKKKIDAILAPYVKRGVMAYNKTAGSMYGANGWPDYDGALCGLFWAIEAKAIPTGKTTPGKLTAMQIARMGAIKKASGYPMVIHELNIDKLDLALQRIERVGVQLQAIIRAHS